MDSPLELLRRGVEVLHRTVGLLGAPLDHVADAEADDDSSDNTLLLASAEALGQVLRGNDDFTHYYSFRVSSHYNPCKYCEKKRLHAGISLVMLTPYLGIGLGTCSHDG